MTFIRTAFVIFSMAIASWAHAADVAVVVSVNDGTAFTKVMSDALVKFLKTELPNHEVKTVNVRARMFAPKRRTHEQLVNAVREIQLQPEDRITHLVIATHGNTIESEHGLETTLRHVGGFDGDGVSSDFQEVFAPLKGRLTPDAKVVLNSCLTFMGTDAQVAARAKSVLNYFGATSGSIYGAMTTEFELPNGRSSKIEWREWFQFHRLLLTAIPIAVSINGVHDLAYTDHVARGLLQLGFAPLIFPEHVLHWTGLLNRGRIFMFKNGALAMVTPVRRFIDEMKIFGITKAHEARTCEALF